MLEIEKVSKAFDHHPVIRDLSLSLKEGRYSDWSESTAQANRHCCE